MDKVTKVSGRAYPLGRDNIDTDVILPGRFLKTITRSGLGVAAFEPVRAETGNVFADLRYVGAPIVIVGANFGCGSSREHAVWAMMDFGIRAVVAESFSDIFASNAFKNGLLAVSLPSDQVAMLLKAAPAGPITIDLPTQKISSDRIPAIDFEIDPFRKKCLLEGLDEIGLTLASNAEVTAFERLRKTRQPWLEVRA
ncbi:3-isopropylmalate dehydratase small subunit [soil metagenome]